MALLVHTIPRYTDKDDVNKLQVHIACRPNPQIELGPVDSSVAVVVCDIEQPDAPIVYASDAFYKLTGYHRSEVLGRNCRFLQLPHGSVEGSNSLEGSEKGISRKLREAIDARNEIQVQIINFKRNGQPFTNFLSIVPINLDGTGYKYAVGFLVELYSQVS
ncbi:vivid pas protein vvd [Metarhizium anisopliae]|nr:vivid pas protein vvd [Metarhizium anisopliae]